MAQFFQETEIHSHAVHVARMSSNSWLYIWDVVLSCHCIIKDNPPTVCVFWLRPAWTAARNRWGCHAANNTSGAWRGVFPFFILLFTSFKKKKTKAMHLLRYQASLWTYIIWPCGEVDKHVPDFNLRHENWQTKISEKAPSFSNL